MTRRPQVLLLIVLLALASAVRPCAAGPWSALLHVPQAGAIVAGSVGSRLHGFDAQSGALLWRHDVESPHTVFLFAHGADVIVVQPRGVKVAQALKRDPDLRVEALDARSGSVRWRYDTTASLVGTPVLAGDRLVLDARVKSANATGVTALDLSTGAVAWTSTDRTQRMTGSTEAVHLLTESAPIHVSTLDPSTGSLRWSSREMRGAAERDPVRVGETLVVTTHETPPATPSETVGTPAAVRHVYGVSARDGTPLYTLDFPDATYEDVRLEGETVVARQDGGARIRVHDASTGARRFDLSLREDMGDKGQASRPLVTDARLFVATSSTPDRFNVQARDARNGAPIARTEIEGALESPLQATAHGLLLGVNRGETTGRVLVCLDPQTLTTRWTLALSEALGDDPMTEVASASGPLLQIRTNAGLRLVDARSGEARAEIEADLATLPLFVSDRLIYGDNNLRFVVVDPAAPETPLACVGTKAWFNTERLPNLVFVAIIVALIVYFIGHARRDSNLFIRRLPGLNALDDAVGRATEMGKPVLYVCGTQDVDEIETLAGLSILGHVAKRAAEYETPLMVPTSRSVVMSTAQEVVREAHYKAGRPDAYNQDNIRYLTDDQFGYVAGVDGIMMRERPAANFYMGMFFGESLILAETGHATGAIQIAGTAQAAQLPFFVAACDYTLMGEELFAASAYLSRDPREVGSLKGQDYAKAAIMTVILLASAAYPWWPQIKTWLSQ